jgi:hypothetical protein
MLITDDSHTRLCATKFKSERKDKYEVQGLAKPGAGAGILVSSANSDITNLTKNDVGIFVEVLTTLQKIIPKGP